MQPNEQAHDLIARAGTFAKALEAATTSGNHSGVMKRKTSKTFWDEVIVEIKKLQHAKIMNVVLASVGNPDFGQDPDQSMPGVPNQIVPVKDLADASKLCRAYIDEHDLGGGNWSGGLIFRDGKEYAKVSYNGRVWSLPQNINDAPLFEPGGRKAPPEKMKWETATLEIEGHGKITLGGCFRVATCTSVPGQFESQGKNYEFQTYISVDQDGLKEIPKIDFVCRGPSGPISSRGFPPFAEREVEAAIEKGISEWLSDPLNASMFLRNELIDRRDTLSVMERNIGYVQDDLARKRTEVEDLQSSIKDLEAKIESPATPAPQI